MAIDFSAERLLLPLVIAARAPEATGADRRRLMLRGLAFGAAGLPPVVGAVDAVGQVRAIRRRLPTTPPVGGVDTFAVLARDTQATLEQQLDALNAAIAAAEAEIEAAKQAAAEATEELKEKKEAVEAAKDYRKQLEGASKVFTVVQPAP